MPNFQEVLDEITLCDSKNPLDTIRQKYLKQICDISGRNTIAYYSGWLQRPRSADTHINDKDKQAFMLTVHRMNRRKGLDILLHTPGGDIAATESLVDYLKSLFQNDIRAIIPQISMSAGTMMALACKAVVMGRHSNLGPIDPQIGGIACQAVIEEFEQAKEDIKKNPHAALLWQTIISKYHPTFLGTCQRAIDWSEELVYQWLKDNMCKGDRSLADQIRRGFSDHSTQKSHSRHISPQKCRDLGIVVENLEDNQDFQEAVLTTHHAFMHTLSQTSAVKIIENCSGIAYIESISV